jgi:hypothetical protein
LRAADAGGTPKLTGRELMVGKPDSENCPSGAEFR